MKKLDIVRPRCRSLKSKILRGKLSLFDLFGACCTLDSPQFWDWESLRWVRVWKLIDQFIGHVFIFHIIRPLSFLLLHRLILLSGHSDFAIWVSSNHQTWRLEITWSHHQKRDIHRLTMVDSSNSLGHRDRAPMFKPFLGFPVGIPNPWVSINTQHVRWLKHVYWANIIFMTSWKQASFVDDQFSVDFWMKALISKCGVCWRRYRSQPLRFATWGAALSPPAIDCKRLLFNEWLPAMQGL